MKNRRHIRILAGLLDRRAGSHIYHRELAMRLAAKGHRVSVVSFEDDSEVGKSCEVYSAGPLPEPLPVLWRYHTWFKYRHCGGRLRAMRLDRPDVLIAGEHLFLPHHLKLFPGVPWIYLPHSLVLSHEIDGYELSPVVRNAMLKLYRHIQRWSLEHADCTLRFTAYSCRVLTADYNDTLQPRYVVNPIGIDLPATVTAPDEHSPPRLLAVGSLNARKRVDAAIRVLGDLGDLPWEFDIVGDGPDRARAEKLAADLKISHRVHFHGYQDNPCRWYQRADLLLVLSRSESLGMVIIEAMSHGVPVMSMRADGKNFFNPNEEMIDDGVNGFLADSDSHLREQLGRVLRDLPVLRKAGIEARRTVDEKFTWDRHLDRYEALFSKLIGKDFSQSSAEADL